MLIINEDGTTTTLDNVREVAAMYPIAIGHLQELFEFCKAHVSHPTGRVTHLGRSLHDALVEIHDFFGAVKQLEQNQLDGKRTTNE